MAGPHVSSGAQPPEPPTLPLQSGERMSRAEFERRYHALPHLKKAELIEGVVEVPSPTRLLKHGRPHGRFVTWLGVYEANTPGVLMGDNTSVRLDMENMPQPDALLLIDPECGGQACISADDYVEEAPELLGEIAASSAVFDLHSKFRVYQRNGVREYIVWRVLEETIDWFVLHDGGFEPLAPASDGNYHSSIFPGLWLDAAALARADMERVLQVLTAGLASPEHAGFVQRLAGGR